MIVDPLPTPSLPAEGVAGSFTLREFDGLKTIRHGANTQAAGKGLKDIITISHSVDPKTRRQRSLFRVDFEHTVTDSEGTPVVPNSTETVIAYVVLDYVPSKSLAHVDQALTRLSTLWNNGAIASVINDSTKVLFKWLRGEP